MKGTGCKGKAIWWFTPSLLEATDGPWGRADDLGGDPTAVWSAIIDWAADLGVDRIITGVAPFQTDRIIVQWPFHYVCHFPTDPQARYFDDEAIDRHITTVRRIADHGRQRGVGIMLHHYNCIAPERWVDSHPVLAEKLNEVVDPVFGRRAHVDRLGHLVGNVCWRDDDYKDFMIRCWCELYSNIPELAGLMITAGEFNYCRCPACCGAKPTDIFEQQQNEQAETVNDQRVQMAVDLIRTFQQTMHDHDKQAMVRVWMMENWADQLPAGHEYVTKFSVNDACWAGPDPSVHRWLDCGHHMWISKAIEAENCGPIIWHDEHWCRQTAEKLNQLPSVGTIIHINSSWGHNGLSTFTASRNIQRLLEQTEPHVPAGSSLADFCAFFGEANGQAICEAAGLIASVPLNMTSIIHLKCEGFTFGFFNWFDGANRWPGVLGTNELDPPDWANPDGLITMTQLMKNVQTTPDVLKTLIENSGHSVIGRLDEMTRWAGKGIRLLESCAGSPDRRSKGELDTLIASGHIAEGLALEFSHVLRARLAWCVLGDLVENDSRATAVHEMVTDHYSRAVAALRRQLGWSLTLAGKHVDFNLHIGEARDIYSPFPMARRLKLREEELHRLGSYGRSHEE